ncbi:MAG TPA: ATP-dependent DNA helicase RecG [Acidimicrobiales bacterium]|nr:ATP-dependent DNA helicase RecG [Acidimicrobiales bacterium]
MTTLGDLALIEVGRLSSVSADRADKLAQVGVETVLDLVTHYPRRYVDRTNQVTIDELVEGEEATVLATVRKVGSRPTRSRRPMVEADLFDGRGYLHLTFFNQPWRAKQLREGTEVVVWGKVERFRGRRQMTNPVVDLVGDRTGRIVPVYPQSEKAGLTSWQIAANVEEALDTWCGDLVDPLPAGVRERRHLAGRAWALRATHLPDTEADHRAGRRRLGFDELLRLQLILVMRKRATEREARGIRHSTGGQLVDRFLAGLPYALTGAQRRAIDEIRADMAGPHPMHRLLQGDVGAGKTLVALAAMLTSVEGGHQAAMMAPTEVLAEQHHANLTALVQGLQVDDGEGSLFASREVTVGLLTNRTTAAARARLHARLAEGGIDILVGTHALLTEAVTFADLGAVVIDEQHRFGVEQRAVLRTKGAGESVPDVLVMTATPIPRTAAMTVFGDLDTTVLDELPPGRTPVTTVWARGELEEAAAWERVRTEVAAGRQAYVVCPLVEGSERVQARSATEEYEQLAAGELAGLGVGLLHGQLPAAEKDAVMERYRVRKLDVLVATTVIEVGVDVPNATVMVIEDADRFGMAQLHQLRGRVGRGADQSWCFLFGAGATEEAATRLQALVDSTDGFALAEIDLDLRGEGTILGARQKGVSDLKLASLRRHRKTVGQAREVAFELVDSGELARNPELAEELRLLVDPDEQEYLFKS